MRRLSGRPSSRKRATKRRTDASELRSSGSTMTSALGHSATTRARASAAALRLRAGSTSLTPRLASTRAVSAPIPDVAPASIVMRRPAGRGVSDLINSLSLSQ
jgi:hypothetical protein